MRWTLLPAHEGYSTVFLYGDWQIRDEGGIFQIKYKSTLEAQAFDIATAKRIAQALIALRKNKKRKRRA